jgi:type IV secretion system protein VirB1
MDLLTLVVLCAPLVDSGTTLRVIAAESAGDPYAIHDNSDGATYRAGNPKSAVAIATLLIRERHRIDLGLMQINYDVWLEPAHFSLERAFDPCTNIRLGSTVLSANYAHALPRSSSSQEALYRALSAYNSGSEVLSWGYARNVLKPRGAGRRQRP